VGVGDAAAAVFAMAAFAVITTMVGMVLGSMAVGTAWLTHANVIRNRTDPAI
jgi:hypothetical protein